MTSIINYINIRNTTEVILIFIIVLPANYSCRNQTGIIFFVTNTSYPLHIQVLLSLLSLATAVPVFVTQDDMNYMMHIFGAYYPIDRSDQEGVSTSSGGNYGTSGYAGGDLGGSYGDGGLDNGSGGHLESSGDQYNGGHQDRFTPISSSYTSGFDAGHGGDDGGHAVSLEGNHNYVHSVPISEHIEVTKPVAVPVYKHVGNVYSHCILRS